MGFIEDVEKIADKWINAYNKNPIVASKMAVKIGELEKHIEQQAETIKALEEHIALMKPVIYDAQVYIEIHNSLDILPSTHKKYNKTIDEDKRSFAELEKSIRNWKDGILTNKE